MSDEETYTTPEGVEPRGGREVALGIPEKQPKDLGVHKIVFDNRSQDNPAEVNLKAKESFAQAITIVQEEYCNKEKDAKKKIKDVRNRLISASIICLLFVGLEFAGGYFSNSLIIVADAAQLLTVFSTMMVSLFALRVSGRKPHSSSGFVWYQAEAMMSLASVLVTWMLTSVVMFLAYQRILCFKEDKFKIDVDMMLATSAFGVVANLVCCLVKWDLHQYLLRMGMVLHNNCHVRSCHAVHDLSEAPVANVNVRAAFIHIVCDFLFSLGVFVTALFIDCCPDWHIVDPISSLVFSCFVLFISLAVLKDVLNVLIEDMPKGIYFNDVLKTFLTIDGVQQVQDLRLWAHSLDKIALSAHLTIRPGVDHNEVLKTASRRIHTKYNFYEMTLHVEALQEENPVEPIKEKK